MSVPDEVWEQADAIEGWLSRSEADQLFRLATGRWCELGSFNGRSTVVLAATGHPGIAIDWGLGSPEHPEGTDTRTALRRNLASYPNVVTLVARFEDCHKFVPRGLNLLFLDADHSYEGTRDAFRLYSEKVAVGGHAVFHDAEGGYWPEVERFTSGLNDDWERAETAERSVAFKRLG